MLLVHYYDPHQYYVANEEFHRGRSRVDRYDTEVQYTDWAIGPLLDAIEEATDLSVIVTSDHGEELWDHGYVAYSYALYDESSRVFLVMRSSGEVRRVVEYPVSNGIVTELLLGTLTDHIAMVTKGAVRLHQGSKRGVVVDGWKAIWEPEYRRRRAVRPPGGPSRTS